MRLVRIAPDPSRVAGGFPRLLVISTKRGGISSSLDHQDQEAGLFLSREPSVLKTVLFRSAQLRAANQYSGTILRKGYRSVYIDRNWISGLEPSKNQFQLSLIAEENSLFGVIYFPAPRLRETGSKCLNLGRIDRRKPREPLKKERISLFFPCSAGKTRLVEIPRVHGVRMQIRSRRHVSRTILRLVACWYGSGPWLSR